MNAGFKGVWISSEIWMKDDLTLIEKVFLVEIVSLDKQKGCYASNAHFSEFFNLSKTRCSAIIRKLRDKGYIFINYFYEFGKKLIERRIIEVNRKIIEQKNRLKKVNKVKENVDKIGKEVDKYQESVVGFEERMDESQEVVVEFREVGNELQEEVVEVEKELDETQKYVDKRVEVKDENKDCEDIEIDKNNNKKIRNNEHKSIYVEVITYLNERCKTNYRYTTKKTQRSINARVRDGYSIEDFKVVIDKKFAQWSNSSMKIYLRPETLFGTKFERYLNEESKEIEYHFNNTKWRGGQAYGKQFKNARGSRAIEDIKEGAKFSNTELSAEDLEWAARELF